MLNLHQPARWFSIVAVVAGVVLLACSHGAASAQGFAAAISPPRLEVQIEPGKVHRRTVDITQAAESVGRYKVYTVDWQLSDEQALTFFEKIQPGSCRPWVAIEAREIELRPKDRMRFRIEIAPPADATPRECRFAIMFEGATSDVNAEGVNFPISGRIAVVVYAALGDIAPRIEVIGTEWVDNDGQKSPAIKLKNSGTATARPGGKLLVHFSDPGATGATPGRLFSPGANPILPGATAVIPLTPDDGKPVSPAGRPFSVTGKLELGYAASEPVTISTVRRDE